MKSGKKEITATFKTITPLWTGDAWGECKEIRPSSLIGSLRFWFEIVCYFSGICKDEEDKDSNITSGRFEKEVDRKSLKEFIQKNGNDINGIIKHLIDNQNIPIPSVIFGTTNWRSLIEIKKVEPVEDYCFGNKLNLPYAISIRKDNYDIEEYKSEQEWKNKINTYNGNSFKENLKNAKKEYSFFFYPNPYFFGRFQVIFKVEEKILEANFYPLLNYMDKYGFWGGKWNIGYGRLKIEEIQGIKDDEWRKEEILFNNKTAKFNNFNFIDINASLNLKSKPFEFLKYFLGQDSFYCNNERDFKNKRSSIPKKLKVLKINNLNENYITLIKKLLKKKAEMRNCLRSNNQVHDKKQWDEFRHKLFGTTTGETEGTKIIPWIYEKDGQLKGGFVSIAGIINIGG
ncbi:type III-B CRISPR module RAMP protein Cmr1 [Desulfurobacterium sp.]